MIKQRKYSEGEIAFIKREYGKKTAKDIAQKLGRSKRSTDQKISHMGIRNIIKKWTPEEEKYLCEHYGKQSSKKIAKKLSRTVVAVGSHAQFQGLRIPQGELEYAKSDYSYLSETQAAYLAGLIDGDGSISVMRRRKYFTAVVEVVTISIELKNYLSSLLTHSKVTPSPPRWENNKPTFKIQVAGLKTLPLIERLIPYLVLKKEKAKLVAKYIQLRKRESKNSPYSNECINLVAQMRRLSTKKISEKSIENILSLLN